MRLGWLLWLLAFGVLADVSEAHAQVAAGVEVARERATWHFDNPSSIDTLELVPHFFEQDYELDNLWFNASAVYRVGVDWRSFFGVTPVTQATATDYDTFFDPGNVTWVAGTTGEARMHSFRLGQEVRLGTASILQVTGGYRLRIDLADFLEGDRTVTRNGLLISQTVVTTREYTNAQTHEIFVSALAEGASTRRWRLRARGDVAPAAINRLAIQLPDKYPGQTLVYRTANLVTSGHVDVIHGVGRWPIVLRVRGERSWNYGRTKWVARSGISAGVWMGTAP